MTRSGGVRLRPVDPPDLAKALRESLAGGPPIAPLPSDLGARAQVLAMLQPDRPVTEPEAAVVVATSGSTGRPKGVVLSRAAVAASAAATQERLGGPGDWVLALPAHYVAGVMVLARAELSGGRVGVARSDLSDLAGVAGGLGARRYLSVVPTQLTRALADPGVTSALATFSAVLVGGGGVDEEVVDHARRLGVEVVTTYGMSETCGGCVYDGRPLPGTTVELDETGRVSLGGPTLFSGYRLRPDLTHDVLRGRRLLTQDRGRWVADRLQVLGRLDDVVVSGGLNVDLAEVERRARPWPQLAGAELVVIGVVDPEWGTKVVAVTDAVRTDGAVTDPAVELAELRGYLSATLPAYAAPRALVHLESLPRTSSGKIDRPALRSWWQKGQP